MQKENAPMTKQAILEKLLEMNPELDEGKLSEALDTVFETIALALVCGDRVEIRHFGSLVVKKRKKAEVRNPKNGVKVQVADRGALYFRASRELMRSLNKNTSNDNSTVA